MSRFMDGSSEPTRVHTEARLRFEAEAERAEQQANRISLARLVLFLGAAITITTGWLDHDGLVFGAGLATFVAFFVAVAWHARVLARADRARVRRDVHDRHLARLTGGWAEFANLGDDLLPTDHAYAWDIDLVGPGSLFQRIDVSHTVHGARALADWLGAAATAEVIAARQQAVAELAPRLDWRQELEAAALDGGATERLDGRAFAEFARLPSLFEARPWLTPAIFALPPLTLLAYLAGTGGLVPTALWLVPFAAQVALSIAHARHAQTSFDLGAAREGVIDGFARLLGLCEGTRFESALLRELGQRLAVHGRPPSVEMRRLRGWVSASELRRQFLFHVVINPFLLWDLHVLRGLERWNREVGRHTGIWFDTLGEFESLASLATLLHGDASATFPVIADVGEPLTARALAHPLLPSATRVANDIALRGPGTVLIVTGSNMAGKSTLLRAVGLNVALAQAGGPVCAAALRVPRMRLRASMRAEDSLQRGASYFHAELNKLRAVLADAEAQPPVLFLLDELLRGTNARARHVGGRAVVLHLLARGATGLVATHDIALSRLAQDFPAKADNAHFTDVVVAGEMRFDYRLRPGVVRTSNALRLLALAGVDVPPDVGDQVESGDGHADD